MHTPRIAGLAVLLAVCVLRAQESGISLVHIADGFIGPTDIQNSGDHSGRLFVTEIQGTIRIIRDGAILPQPFLDITSRVRIDKERGLLALAFPPDFARKQRFYVHYCDLDGNSVIAMYRVTANPDVADRDSEIVVLRVDQVLPDHKGGQLRFGGDGYLYVGLGDGGGGSDPFRTAQNLGVLFGKILRLDVESDPGKIRIPTDNPFVNSPGARPEIWAYGLRNPWRFSFDRANGDLYIADVGQDAWEEVNYAPASSRGGENYGWSETEGLDCFRQGCATRGLTPPVAVYGHSGGDCAVIGGLVYRGRQSPGLRGTYLYGDFCSNRLRTLWREGGKWVSRIALEIPRQTTTFGEDEEGEIYVATGGAVYRIAGSQAPRLAAADVSNAASFETGIVAGSLASVIAPGLLDDSGMVSATDLPLPLSLAGISVSVNGSTAPILSVSNSNGVEQAVFQVPYSVTGHEFATVVVSRGQQTSAPVEVPVWHVQPGVFAHIEHNADYSAVTGDRALRREEYAFAYAVGLGEVSNPPAAGVAATSAPPSVALENVQVRFGGLDCVVPFAGLKPGFAGVYQVTFRVPPDVDSGLQELVVSVAGLASPPVKVPVE